MLARLRALAALASRRKSRDAVPLDWLLPRVRFVPLGGMSRPVAELRLRDLADLQGWLADQAPHPLRDVPPERLDPEPETRRARLQAAWKAARDWPPRLGSEDAAALLESPAGRVAFVAVCLRRCDPSVTAEDAATVAAAMDAAEWANLRRVAWGLQPWRELQGELDPTSLDAPDAGPPDWTEAFHEIAGRTGWTFDEIGALTLGQYRAIRSGSGPVYRGLTRRHGETPEQLAARERETFGG